MAAFLTLLAPGANVTAAGITEVVTSQATPHVSGVLARLRGLYPQEPLSQAAARLALTGVVDTRSGITIPRMNEYAAAIAGTQLQLTGSGPTSATGIGITASYVLTVTNLGALDCDRGRGERHAARAGHFPAVPRLHRGRCRGELLGRIIGGGGKHKFHHPCALERYRCGLWQCAGCGPADRFHSGLRRDWRWRACGNGERSRCANASVVVAAIGRPSFRIHRKRKREPQPRRSKWLFVTKLRQPHTSRDTETSQGDGRLLRSNKGYDRDAIDR